MINRILSAKILSVLLVILLVSCGGPSGSPSGADTAADVTADAVIAETETDIYADLPKSDFGGYEFRILNNISNFAMTTMFAEELNGEPVNDAIYNRNALVEQDLNINMVEQMQNGTKLPPPCKTDQRGRPGL